MSATVSFEYLTELLDKINTDVGEIQSIIGISEVISTMSRDSALNGLGVDIINIGNTYNFWGSGQLNHVQTFQNGIKYKLMEGSQFQKMSWYVGNPCVVTMWILPTGGTPINVPVYIDGSGVYFYVYSSITNLPIGTTFSFVCGLILLPPSL